MRNDSTLNFALVGIHRTAVAVSALVISLSVSAVYAADPPVPRGNVSVNVNPTTSYYTVSNSTLRLPNGVSVSPSAATPPVVSKYSGGLQQTIPTGITIDAIKKSAPLPAVVRSTTQSVKGAATRCLKSGRCNVALIVAGEGLSRLFDGLDWVMGEGGKIQRKAPASEAECPECAFVSPPTSNGTAKVRKSLRGSMPPYGTLPAGATEYLRTQYANDLTGDTWQQSVVWGCYDSYRDPFSGRTYSFSSYAPTTYYDGRYGNVLGLTCYYDNDIKPEESYIDLSDSDIEAGVADNYEPEPSDWPALTPEMQPDDIEITSAPTLKGEPVTTTVYDADGNPHKVTQTNIWYDFDIRDNPSPRPALDMKTREETETYENGELTGTTTTESTTSAGSGSSPESPPESPIDCDLFPTACAWFDWTQEEPTEPDDDLSGLLQEVPIVSETFTITGGVAACPAPLVLDLSVFGSHEVSYQPLCDLASTMKYLYLALMSFAAAVLLNRSVNRV